MSSLTLRRYCNSGPWSIRDVYWIFTVDKEDDDDLWLFLVSFNLRTIMNISSAQFTMAF